MAESTTGTANTGPSLCKPNGSTGSSVRQKDWSDESKPKFILENIDKNESKQTEVLAGSNNSSKAKSKTSEVETLLPAKNNNEKPGQSKFHTNDGNSIALKFNTGKSKARQASP